MVGQIALSISLLSAVAGSLLYFLVARGRTELLTTARAAAHLSIISMLVAAGTLLYLIFTYRFDYIYIYEHVSRSLSKPLLFSTFYASQEGSFMLWGLLTAIVAIFVMPYAARQRYEAPVMSVYLIVLIFITAMLVIRTPFETIYAAHPGQIAAGVVPQDGKGLNPSLENLWIAIHPPMLFAGFTLLAVPFAFAIAGLWRRDYQGWVTTSLPWTLGGGMILGFGIILGGFWAYETLGWGGYWAWDPVENASLLPWLITVAAFHTMLTQQKTGGLVKTNIVMTLLAYALVIYCSFMTRSGILSDASVHSFVAPGNDVFRMLVIALGLFILGPLTLFLLRVKEMNIRGREYKFISRETALSIGAAILGASALIVFAGTSAPIIKKKVDIDFYASLHVPIAIALTLVNALSLLLKWKQSSVAETLRKGIWAAIASMIITVFLSIQGINDVGYVLIIFGALLALFINIELLYSITGGKITAKIDKRSGITGAFIGTIRWMIPLGILALIIGTNGDYYKFGYAILDYGLYWAAMSVIVFMVFALVGRLRLEMGLRLSGAYVAHIGLLLFIIGVVASSHYEEHKEYELIRGEPIKVFDKYTLQYDGYTTEPPQKYRFFLNLRDDDGNVVTADPTLFSTAFDNFQSVNPQPSIVKYASRDVYFTVRGIERTGGPPIDSLRKGQSMAFFDGKLDLTFDEFEFLPEERQKMMAGEAFTVKAKFLAKVNGHSEPIPVTASVTRTLNDQQHDAADVEIEGTPYHIRLAELRPDLNDRSQSMVLFEYFDENVPPPPISQKLYVEAFIKPYINFVWAGVIILMIGFGFSTFRRRREALVAIERAEKIVERRRAKNAADAEAIHRQGYPSDLQKRQESSNVDEVH